MTTEPKWTPESEVDPETGASVYRRAHMAAILKISERQLDRLALAGKLPVRADGRFFVRQTIDAFAEYAVDKASRPTPQDALKRRQAQSIERKMAREEADLIMMVDATEVMDFMTSSFLDAVNLVETEVSAMYAEDHVLRVVRPVFKHTREHLTDVFAEHRAALIAGPKKSSRS